MPSSETVRAIRRLGSVPRIGAIVLAEPAVDTDAGLQAEDRDIAHDRFIGEVERSIDLLHRDLSRRAA